MPRIPFDELLPMVDRCDQRPDRDRNQFDRYDG